MGKVRARIEKLKELVKTQSSEGNFDYDNYMLGMANGMILSLAVIEDCTPVYLDEPKVWGKDKPIKSPIEVNNES